MRIRIFGQFVHLSIAVLALVEFAICLLAAYGAAHLRFGFDGIPLVERQLVVPAVICACAMVACMTAVGLYAFQQRAGLSGIVMRLLAAALFSGLIIAIVVYVLPGLQFGRGVLAITLGIAVIGCLAARLVFTHVIGDEVMKRRVLVYGAGARARSIALLRRSTDRRGFAVVGFVRGNECEVLVPPEKILEATGSLYETVRQYGASEVVVALDNQRNCFPMDELLKCRVRGVNVIDVVSFIERETGKVRLDLLNPSWIIFSGGFRRDVARELVERGFDIVASLLLLVLSWPVMLLTALAIKLEDGWRAPVLYVQERVGLEGRSFLIRKFRSMRTDAEQDGKPAWASENDPRVTRVGAVIRKLRIDELPQLFNVLAGDMCFVGPRPERPQFVEQLGEKIPYYHERHWVKPGITGWAQLCYPYGASERDATEKLQYDLYYVKHRNLLFDIAILLETAEIVLWGRGAR